MNHDEVNAVFDKMFSEWIHSYDPWLHQDRKFGLHDLKAAFGAGIRASELRMKQNA